MQARPDMMKSKLFADAMLSLNDNLSPAMKVKNLQKCSLMLEDPFWTELDKTVDCKDLLHTTFSVRSDVFSRLQKAMQAYVSDEEVMQVVGACGPQEQDQGRSFSFELDEIWSLPAFQDMKRNVKKMDRLAGDSSISFSHAACRRFQELKAKTGRIARNSSDFTSPQQILYNKENGLLQNEPNPWKQSEDMRKRKLIEVSGKCENSIASRWTAREMNCEGCDCWSRWNNGAMGQGTGWRHDEAAANSGRDEISQSRPNDFMSGSDKYRLDKANGQRCAIAEYEVISLIK
eukprot:346302-Hanusia_phi.AAC.2